MGKMKTGVDWKILSLLLFSAAAAFVLLLFNNPNESGNILPQCLFYKCTGLYCPGCGGTRALYAIMHGHICEALRQNLLVFLLVPIFIILIFFPETAKKRGFAQTVLVVILAFFALRNIPAFSFLAPF